MNAQQLKNSILQEDIEGRLVPQDPNDEPASVLLNRIRKEKAQLVKEGKLKKKDLVETPISEEEIPFEIPENWEWVRLASLSLAIHYGYTASAASKGNSKLLRITDIQNDAVDWKCVPYCTTKEKDLKTYQLRNRDILVARTGGTIGKTYIVRELDEIAVFASYLIRVIPLYEVNEEFLKLFMMTPCYWKQLIDVSSGTGQPNVNGQSLSNLILPIPPKEEQKRILLKYKELLPKVEEYGKAQEALDKLNAELPERLKKSILQEAIEGRLVPQDPNDEPASVLLDRIRKEKARLVKEGKLKKKDLVETPISEEEIPFEIPESWEWVRVRDVFMINPKVHADDN
ncbi:MAG: restriction endonuclease subunit S, partial [Bacteroidaceae bacterium]|nr:restriction endonuclease subunit S [Bacteroidaceae bacterium]